MTFERRVRVGVIGCGYWGPKIIRNLTELSDAELALVCDLSEVRLASVAQRWPEVAMTTDYRDVLRDPTIDAVVIATPIQTHFRLALAAMLQGKHVLVEKPLTASVEEAEKLVDIAAMTGQVLMVGHTYQYNPAVLKLRELVHSGALGQIYYIDCARLNLGLFQRDINVIWDLAPHDISILLHILGRRPIGVSAAGAAHVLKEVDDLAHVNLRFPPDINAYVRLSWLDPCKIRRVTIVGSRRMALFDETGDEKLRIHNRGVVVRGNDGFAGPEFDYHDGEVEVPELEDVEPLRAQLAHFVTCVRTGETPRSDGRAGLEAVRIIEAADRSRRAGGVWIELPEDLPPQHRPPAEAAPAGTRVREASRT
jgi:predicted dehydrogenase